MHMYTKYTYSHYSMASPLLLSCMIEVPSKSVVKFYVHIRSVYLLMLGHILYTHNKALLVRIVSSIGNL